MFHPQLTKNLISQPLLAAMKIAESHTQLTKAASLPSVFRESWEAAMALQRMQRLMGR